jgi:Divergent InlB B-repeat domain
MGSQVRASCWLPVFILLSLSASPASAQTPAATGPWTLFFQSQAGDSIGLGETHSYTDADPGNTFRIGSSVNGVGVSLDGPSFAYWWRLDLHAPIGQPLSIGTYETARRAPFTQFNGLEFSGSGGGCNNLTGRFVVLEAEFASGGRVLKFAADFEQHCGDANAALFGSVRYHSTIASTTPFGGNYSSYKITIAPPAHGTVSAAGMVDCGGGGVDCEETLGAAQSVSLSALPDPGYFFAGWSGDCRGGPAITLHVNGPKQCAAEFGLSGSPDPRTLVVIDSLPGEFVGDGRMQVFSPANSAIMLTSDTNPKSIGFRIASIDATSDITWRFTVTAPGVETSSR